MLAGRKIMDKDKLWLFCEQFIKDQEIAVGEDIYQSDHVIENAYEFIEGICGIVGYADEEDE